MARMRDLEGPERAQLYSAYGYAHFMRGEIAESIQQYERVLTIDDAPEGMIPSTLYTLAQLCFHVERYEKAVDHLERWLALSSNPGPEPFVLMGQAYFQLERYGEAAESVERAIEIAGARGQDVDENWYALLRALYHQMEDHPSLLRTLEILCAKFPSREYWTHLAAVHGEMEDEEGQLATHEIAFRLGYLSSDSELRLFAQLLINAGVPYRAGMILREGLDGGVLESKSENWRLLSQAWTLAHENERAIEALKRAAELASDGELDARLAQSYARLDDWANVITASQNAVRKGAEDAHEMLMLRGVAMIELDRLDEAKAIFQRAQETPAVRERALEWIAYIDSEEARRRELERSLR